MKLEDTDPCNRCGGKGVVRSQLRDGSTGSIKCVACDGYGRIPKPGTHDPRIKEGAAVINTPPSQQESLPPISNVVLPEETKPDPVEIPPADSEAEPDTSPAPVEEEAPAPEPVPEPTLSDIPDADDDEDLP